MPDIPKVILLIENSREAGRGVLRGIGKYSRLYGQWTFYSKPPFYSNPIRGRKELISRMKEFDADGIITRDSEEVKEIAAEGLPVIYFVAMKPPLPHLPWIDTDDDAMGKMAAEHLLDRGFTQFAFCGFYNIPWSMARGRAFSRRITQSGFQTYLYETSRSKSKLSWAKARFLVTDWLKQLPKPIGLMACNDDRAQQVIEAAKTTGLNVPEQVAIVGVDNDDLICDLTNPRLSSIAVDWERAGYEAAELLDKMMAGKKTADKKIIARPTHVVTRQSTDILAIEDREVAEAVRFIRQHAKESVQVSDVVQWVALSRRSLERRFFKALGRSIYDEIKRVRVEQICRILLETNLTVRQIALELHYPCGEHISRFFRQEMGMSPLDYRKKHTSR